MGYYVRVFCASEKKPTIKDVLDCINKSGYGFKVQTNLTEEEENSKDWTTLEFSYKEGKLPILVECNSVFDSDGFAKEEIEEFLDMIGAPGLFSSNKKKLIKHLQNTKFIIANQLPTSDIDDDGYNANGEFLKYFVECCSGIVHADGEGFYEGTKIILKTE